MVFMLDTTSAGAMDLQVLLSSRQGPGLMHMMAGASGASTSLSK